MTGSENTEYIPVLDRMLDIKRRRAFDLLGFRVEKGQFDISDNSLEKIEWKLEHFADRLVSWYRKGELTKEAAMQKMIDRVDTYFFGRVRDENELSWVDWSFGVITRVDSLKRLDACAQECIRYAGSGGKRSDARYRVRYKDMRRMKKPQCVIQDHERRGVIWKSKQM